MHLVYSRHALERMISRKISPEEVENVLENFEGTIRQTKDKTIYYKSIPARLDNQIAVVAVKLFEATVEVLTVMHHFSVKGESSS